MSNYSSQEYWAGLAKDRAGEDSHAFAPVLHPGTPPWFNELIDRLQFRAVRRAFGIAGTSPGDRILDIGCGTGRWLRRYSQFGLQVVGIDATPDMLGVAREKGTAAPLVVGQAQRLPFASESFDCVSDITVIQHIPFPEQAEAIQEMMRVLKPGGRAILMEVIRGKGAHVFPRSPNDWIREFASCEAKLIGYFGQEYLLLDRLLVAAAQKLTGQSEWPGGDSLPVHAVPSRVSRTRRVYWALRRVTVLVSASMDLAAERILPVRSATHGVFVLRK